jgi:hypothetical protein
VPVHSYFTITIEDDNTAAQEKMYITDVTSQVDKGHNVTIGISVEMWLTRTRSLGKIHFKLDTVALLYHFQSN